MPHRFDTAPRSWLTLFAGLLLGLFVSPSPSVRADAGDDLYKVAVGLHDKELWSESADQFRKLFAEHPNHRMIPNAQVYMGDSLIKLKEYDEARKLLRTFVNNNPNHKLLADGMYLVGEASYLLNDAEAAEKELSAYLAKYPGDRYAELALLHLGDAQLLLKQSERAAANFQKSLEQFPQGKFADDARYGLGKAFEAMNQGDKADAIYRALAANTGSPLADDAQNRLAVRLYGEKKYAESGSAYDELATKFPESSLAPQAVLNAALAYYNAGDFETAIARYDRAAENPEHMANARLGKGLSLKSQRRYADAAAVLKETYAAHPDDPVAERLLYYWADAEFNLGNWETARDQFLEVVKRWPQGNFADYSLYNAAEASLFAAKLDETQQLIERFDAEYANSGLRLLVDLLRGRLSAERGSEEQLQQAIVHFNGVLNESSIPRTQMMARRHLAGAYLKLEDYAQVLNVLEPIVADVKQAGSQSEFADVLVIRAEALLREKKYAEAVDSASDYLKALPDGGQAESAVAIKAVASTHLGDDAAAQHNLTILYNKYPNSPTLAQTTFVMANVNYEAEKWEQSGRLYATLAKLGKESPFHAQAVSGQAWCLYHQGQFAPAAEQFGEVVKQHPDDKTAAEAAFMQGKCYESAERFDDAIAAYRIGLANYQPAREAYLSGLQIARLYGRQGEIDKSDAAYEDVIKTFPMLERLDQLFEEWAMVNYEAERYEKSDAVFRRLIEETPESPLVDNARLSLAESDLVNGKLPEAQKVFAELETSPKSDADVQEISLYRLIGIAIDLEKWDDAARWSQQLEARFPESEFIWFSRFQRAESLFHQDKTDDAFAALNTLKAAIDNPAVAEAAWFPRVFILLGEIHLRRKAYSELTAVVDEMKAWDPDSPFLYQAYELQGRALKNQAKFPEAIEAFKKVIDDANGRATETAAKGQFMIAEIYVLQKNFADAKLEYLKVDILYAFPAWQAPALFQAAVCHESLKELELAKKVYADLVRKFPDSEYAAKAAARLKELPR